MDPEKVAAVSKMKSPRTIKELRAILGLVGFYRRFIQDIGKIAEPLYKLLNKKERFSWSKECESAVEQLKQALQKAPILGHPNDLDPYTLTTDASVWHWRNYFPKDINGVKELLHTQAKRSARVNETTLRQNENFLQ